MRISGGYLRGRSIDTPKNSRTHPMGERVRSGLFNTLGDITGLSVLDAFAGSGALSIEAVSRGAANVIAIENDRSAQKAIKTNILNLELSKKVCLVNASASAWLNTSDATFDIILLDPPYDNLLPDLLIKLARRIKVGGIVVLSMPPRSNVILPSDFQIIKSKNYGDAEIHFYKEIAFFKNTLTEQSSVVVA